MNSWDFESVFGSFSPPPCAKCGVHHFAHQLCTYTFAPDASLMVTGEDGEVAHIQRYNTFRLLAEAVGEANLRAASMARLERALERL